MQLSHPDHADPITLLAVWTVRRNGDGRPSYTAQLRETIERWRSTIADGDVVIAGDLNAFMQGQHVDAHRENIEMLEQLGSHSAYHEARGVEHGDEADMTVRWIGPGRVAHYFHCDYVFLSAALADRAIDVEVGGMATWVESGRSDHCPVTVDLELGEADATDR